MDKVITRAYVTHFNEATFTQSLPSGRKIVATYHRNKTTDKWSPIYSTDSAYAICPITGQFRGCLDCDFYVENEDGVGDCLNKLEKISHKELAARATDCLNADGCTVSFRSIDGEL